VRQITGVDVFPTEARNLMFPPRWLADDTMPMQVVMMRAGTAGSVSRVTPDELCRLLTDLGFSEVRSLLQSGNLVFRGDGPTGPELERALEHAVERRFGGAVHLFCRTEEEWKAVVARNPFRQGVAQDPGQLVVMFLKHSPPDARLAALHNIRLGPERSGADGKQLYVLYPNGTAGSHLTRTLIEHQLGTSVTGRSWNTILQVRRRLHEIAPLNPRDEPSPVPPPGRHG
jgi:uncharacterized protein (DUF1697 family)